MRGGRAPFLLPLLLLCWPACGDADPDRAVSVRDSAGIRIVESRAPAWPGIQTEGTSLGDGGWWVAAEPDLRIGTLEGDEAAQLFRVSDATRLPDGRVAVANRGTGEIRVFGRDGAHIVSMGGEGEGPGEFRHMAWIESPGGDSVVVFDPLQRRLTTYLADGTFVGDAPVSVSGVQFPDPSALLPDGRLVDLWRVDEADPAATGHIEPTVGVVVYRPGGTESADTLFTALGTETLRGAVDYQGRTIRLRSPVPFGRTARVDAGGGRLWFGNGQGFEAMAVDPDGGPALLARRRFEPRPATPDDWDRYIESLTEGATAPAAVVEQGVRMLDDAPRDRNMPAYSDLTVDAAGNVWVENFRPEWERESAPRLWTVFDRDGRWLGELELPRGLTVFEIGEDYVLGLARDEMEVEYVVLHRIEKRAEVVP